MAKVKVQMGVTMKIGDAQSYEFFRLDLGVDDLDTDLPIAKQLEAVGTTMRAAYDWLQEGMEIKIKEELNRNMPK